MNITYALGKGTYLSNRYRIDEIIGQILYGVWLWREFGLL